MKVPLALLFPCFSAAALAQTSTGQIDLTVVDGGGAVVPGATVQVVGSQTRNVRRRFRTGSSSSACGWCFDMGSLELAS